jgi:hypothetical protein
MVAPGGSLTHCRFSGKSQETTSVGLVRRYERLLDTETPCIGILSAQKVSHIRRLACNTQGDDFRIPSFEPDEVALLVSAVQKTLDTVRKNYFSADLEGIKLKHQFNGSHQLCCTHVRISQCARTLKHSRLFSALNDTRR